MASERFWQHLDAMEAVAADLVEIDADERQGPRAALDQAGPADQGGAEKPEHDARRGATAGLADGSPAGITHNHQYEQSSS